MVWKRRLRRDQLAQVRWAGLEVLATAHSLNARCMEALAQMALVPPAQEAESEVLGVQELWQQLGADACERASRCPVVLLNLNLENADWWSRARRGEVIVRANPTVPFFSSERAVPLVREILTEARGCARIRPHAARLVFGMSSFVASIIADLSAAEIDRIAGAQGRELRPRWNNQRAFWKGLLEAAISDNTLLLEKVHLHCIQLLGKDLQLASS